MSSAAQFGVWGSERPAQLTRLPQPREQRCVDRASVPELLPSGGCPLPSRVSNSARGLCPLNVPSHDSPKCLQTWPYIPWLPRAGQCWRPQSLESALLTRTVCGSLLRPTPCSPPLSSPGSVQLPTHIIQRRCGCLAHFSLAWRRAGGASRQLSRPPSRMPAVRAPAPAGHQDSEGRHSQCP